MLCWQLLSGQMPAVQLRHLQVRLARYQSLGLVNDAAILCRQVSGPCSAWTEAARRPCSFLQAGHLQMLKS